MKIIFLSILAVAMIGLMVPSVFAAYPDPDKDPKEYLIRYYTEPKYKEWFDTNFPHTTIEERIGYPNKIITNDYYVSPFGFVIEPPKGWELETSPESMADASGNTSAGLVAFSHPRETDCTKEYNSNVIVWHDDQFLKKVSDALDYSVDWYMLDQKMGLLTVFEETFVYDEQTNLKVLDQSIIKLSENEYIVRYDYVDVSMIPENPTPNDDGIICTERNLTMKNSNVIFLQPNGDQFTFIFSGEPHYYDSDIEEVNKMLKTFYVGKTELLSDIMGVPEPEPEPEPEPIPSEPESVVEVKPVVTNEEKIIERTQPICGEGTVMKDGKCVLAQKEKGGGCLIATAAFGSEMAPQVQFLRELRDNTVLQTQAGTTFMTGFNQFYYSFSPAVADYERENPVFKEAVKLTLTPLLTSLAILNYVDIDTEQEMLGYGIGVILLNIGMYFVAPAIVIISLKKRFKF